MNKPFLRLTMAFVLAVSLAACGGGGGDDDDDDGGFGGGDDQSHNSGMDCLTSGCHGAGAERDNRYTYAGTVYSGPGGGSTVSGKTVTITDSSGTFTLTTDSRGNFFTTRGNPGGGYSSVISAAMVTRPTNGSCNTGGCHASGQRLY